MYQLNIIGKDFLRGEVKQLGKAIAVIVPKDWEEEDVIVVRKGKIEEVVDITKTLDLIDKKIEELMEERAKGWKKLKFEEEVYDTLLMRSLGGGDI